MISSTHTSLMAVIKHRKLFPAAPVSTNQTDCPEFCGPDCAYGCYPYADFYIPPPPPFSAIDQNDQNHHISPYVVLLVSLLASLLLLIGYYVIVVKSYTSLCSYRSNGSSLSQSGSTDEEFLAENQVDHPVWLISTVGLQQSIINSITVCKYKKDEGLIEGAECSVCLTEFQEDETLRLLPKCSHAFHVSCIDTWLRSHTNCPLCRANILRPPNLASVDTNEETQVENSESEIALGVDNQRGYDEVCESRAETEDEGEEEHQVRFENASKEATNSNGNSILELIRRSWSFDSSLAANMLVIKLKNAEKLHSDVARKRYSSIGQSLHLSPVLMKRSLRRKWSMISVLPQ
ncbi:PREDICTED: RING-H2 finger protein ATL54-like [Prunus mume]|uniref:RING-type E3 ubiquitin transferase n=1 Tax=Prunus mume TaxID=102107 RepID=A0ABM0N4C6_PRUMU|nr:PREDICTED: RING-H2 finger protein ATL54-like [Prunus mume]